MVFHTVLEVFWEVFLKDFSGIFLDHMFLDSIFLALVQYFGALLMVLDL